MRHGEINTFKKNRLTKIYHVIHSNETVARFFTPNMRHDFLAGASLAGSHQKFIGMSRTITVINNSCWLHLKKHPTATASRLCSDKIYQEKKRETKKKSHDETYSGQREIGAMLFKWTAVESLPAPPPASTRRFLFCTLSEKTMLSASYEHKHSRVQLGRLLVNLKPTFSTGRRMIQKQHGGQCCGQIPASLWLNSSLHPGIFMLKWPWFVTLEKFCLNASKLLFCHIRLTRSEMLETPAICRRYITSSWNCWSMSLAPLESPRMGFNGEQTHWPDNCVIRRKQRSDVPPPTSRSRKISFSAKRCGFSWRQ